MGCSSKKLAVFLLFASLVTVTVSQNECRVAEPHIALGDKFNLENTASDHIFTIGFTMEGICDPSPKVQLKTKEGKTKILDPHLSNSVDLKIPDENNVIVSYQKGSSFFKVTESDFAEYSTWSVTEGTKVFMQPVEFPPRWRESTPNLRMFVVADMDLTPNSVETVKQIEAMSPNDYDIFVHVGDFAYEIEDKGGKKGDEFFAQMSKTTRKVPYLITPGNHELFGNGSLFNYRFRMPNTSGYHNTRKNHFFDMVIKGTYFMMVDFDYLIIYEKQNAENLLITWMKERMEILAKRTDINWKVFVSHRPFECSDWTAKDCSMNLFRYRRYQDLLYKNGFHFMLQGHLHTYTRSKPLKALKVMPESMIGSGAMVSIVDGHSGTGHYFCRPDDEERTRSVIMQTVDSSGPSYVVVEVNPDRFQTQMVRADNGERKDTFSIDRASLDDSIGRSRRMWWVKYVVLVIIAVVLGAIVAATYLYQKKQEVSIVNAKLSGGNFGDTYRKVYGNDKKQVSVYSTDESVSKLSYPNTLDHEFSLNLDIAQPSI
jgi:hypothetical protein